MSGRLLAEISEINSEEEEEEEEASDVIEMTTKSRRNLAHTLPQAIVETGISVVSFMPKGQTEMTT